MLSKRYTALTASALLLLSFCIYKIVQACSEGPSPYDYYPSFFPPSVNQQPAYSPFHYTAGLEYYDEWYDYQSEATIPDANIAAWKAYTGNAIPDADLDSFIYKYPHAQLSSLYFNIEKGKPLQISPEVASNAFTKWFQQEKDLEALGYLMYAKQCEPYVSNGSTWEAPVEDTAKMSRLSKSGLQLYVAAKKDFIKERYAYQVLRLNFYSHKLKPTLALYTRLVGDDKKDGSEIFVRCLGIKAGALFRLKRKAEAAYLYSLVFDRSDMSKRSSYLSFAWATDGIEPVLALCKTPHEQAVVQVMHGLHNFDMALPQMQAAYAADPSVKGLDILMTREINKIEERYQQEQLFRERNLNVSVWYNYRYEGEYLRNDSDFIAKANKYSTYAASLKSFAEKAAAENKSGRAAFWQLSLAYLSYIQKDISATKQYLDKARAAGMSPREQDLHEVITALYLIGRDGTITSKTESDLLPLLTRLDERAAKDGAYGTEGKPYRDLMSTVLTNAYLRNGDTVKAIYTLARVLHGESGSFTVDQEFTDLPGALLERATIAKLNEVEAFIGKPGKSPYEAWLTSGTPYSAAVLHELEGTKYLRQHQFARAAEILAKSSPEVLNRYTLPDPFLARVRDSQEPDALDSAHLYNKLTFAQKMAALEGKDDATSLFEYGCGLYSMTYYGKASHAFAYYRSTVDVLAYYSTPQREALPPYLKDYYSANLAELYFIRASEKTTDLDFRSKCLFMAGKCWQKRCPLPSTKEVWEMDDNPAYYRYSITNPYFRKLEGYASVPFMRKAYSTCGYLRDYAKKK